MSEKPIRKVSAKKYQVEPVGSAAGVATIRMKMKGATDGPIYRGQTLVQPCASCSGSPG